MHQKQHSMIVLVSSLLCASGVLGMQLAHSDFFAELVSEFESTEQTNTADSSEGDEMSSVSPSIVSGTSFSSAAASRMNSLQTVTPSSAVSSPSPIAPAPVTSFASSATPPSVSSPLVSSTPLLNTTTATSSINADRARLEEQLERARTVAAETAAQTASSTAPLLQVAETNNGSGTVAATDERSAEEIRQAEDLRKANIESLQRIETERREQERTFRESLQQREESLVVDTQQPASIVLPERTLTCLDAEGVLTTERDACDMKRTQEEVAPVPTLTPEQEIVVQQKAAERYLGDKGMTTRRQEILHLIETTHSRLVTLRDSGVLPDKGSQDFLNQSIEWLTGAYTFFTNPARTPEDINTMQSYLRQIIDYTQQLIEQARGGQGAPEIRDIVLRTDRILQTLPEIFWILEREDVAYDAALLEDYATANQVLLEIKTHCPADQAQCRRIGEVINSISAMQDAIRTAISASGKTEVEAMIEEVIRVQMAGEK